MENDQVRQLRENRLLTDLNDAMGAIYRARHAYNRESPTYHALSSQLTYLLVYASFPLRFLYF